MLASRRDTRPADHEDCQSVATLVMALFDGEADELQARRARKHLLICQTCANRWLDWNSARSLLLSVPAPTPPETLMWRVLSACRRAGAQRAHSTVTQNPVHEAPLQRPLEVPSALSQQILQRTTRAGATDAAKTRRVTWSTSRRALAWPALAAPSLALWLLVLQREPLLTSAQVSPDASESSAASDPDIRFPNRVNGLSRSRRATLRPAANFRLPAPSSAGADEALNSPAIDFPTSASEVAPAGLKTSRADARQPNFMADSAPEAPKTRVLSNSELRLARQWDEIQALTSQAARSVVFQPSETAPETNDSAWQTADYRVESAANSAAPRAVLTRLTTTPRRVALAARLRRPPFRTSRGAELSSLLTSPRLRAANWRISAPRGAFSGSATPPAVPSRVSLPANMAPATARLIAENFDAEDPRADDGHLDEMRSVVDDFRATIASETTPDAGEDDGG